MPKTVDDILKAPENKTYENLAKTLLLLRNLTRKNQKLISKEKISDFSYAFHVLGLPSGDKEKTKKKVEKSLDDLAGFYDFLKQTKPEFTTKEGKKIKNNKSNFQLLFDTSYKKDEPISFMEMLKRVNIDFGLGIDFDDPAMHIDKETYPEMFKKEEEIDEKSNEESGIEEKSVYSEAQSVATAELNDNSFKLEVSDKNKSFQNNNEIADILNISEKIEPKQNINLVEGIDDSDDMIENDIANEDKIETGNNNENKNDYSTIKINDINDQNNNTVNNKAGSKTDNKTDENKPVISIDFSNVIIEDLGPLTTKTNEIKSESDYDPNNINLNLRIFEEETLRNIPHKRERKKKEEKTAETKPVVKLRRPNEPLNMPTPIECVMINTVVNGENFDDYEDEKKVEAENAKNNKKKPADWYLDGMYSPLPNETHNADQWIDYIRHANPNQANVRRTAALVFAARILVNSERGNGKSLKKPISGQEIDYIANELVLNKTFTAFIRSKSATEMHNTLNRYGHGGYLEDEFKKYLLNRPAGELHNDKLLDRFMPRTIDRIDALKKMAKAKGPNESINKEMAEVLILRRMAGARRNEPSIMVARIPTLTSLSSTVKSVASTPACINLGLKASVKKDMKEGHGGLMLEHLMTAAKAAENTSEASDERALFTEIGKPASMSEALNRLTKKANSFYGSLASANLENPNSPETKLLCRLGEEAVAEAIALYVESKDRVKPYSDFMPPEQRIQDKINIMMNSKYFRPSLFPKNKPETILNELDTLRHISSIEDYAKKKIDQIKAWEEKEAVAQAAAQRAKKEAAENLRRLRAENAVKDMESEIELELDFGTKKSNPSDKTTTDARKQDIKIPESKGSAGNEANNRSLKTDPPKMGGTGMGKGPKPY